MAFLSTEKKYASCSKHDYVDDDMEKMMSKLLDRIVADDKAMNDMDGARLKENADRMNNRWSSVDAKERVCLKWTQEEREVL